MYVNDIRSNSGRVSSESTSSCTIVRNGIGKINYAHQGDNVIEQVCLSNSHARQSILSRVHDMDMEMICEQVLSTV
jgi:hypothetical protein